MMVLHGRSRPRVRPLLHRNADHLLKLESTDRWFPTFVESTLCKLFLKGIEGVIDPRKRALASTWCELSCQMWRCCCCEHPCTQVVY